jgi:glycosyltransferase involved in cell wall biosynthesis
MAMNSPTTSGGETGLVSVIIPAWNRAALLPETLRSLQAQTYRRFEAIIVDDGSTDDTAIVARQFCETDPRFHLVQQPKQGISAARNAAIDRARGEFIAFLDSDDFWLPDLLLRLTDLMREDPRVNLSFANFYLWDGRRDLSVYYGDHRPLPEGDAAPQLVFLCDYAIGAVMLRREMLAADCRFDPQFDICEDWDLWQRLAERGLWARGTREPLMCYRRWPGSVSGENLKILLGNVRVLEKNLGATQRPELRSLYRRSLGLARARVELARARRLMDSAPDQIPAAIWRAWRAHPTRLMWLVWWALAAWPKLLGGRATARIVHRKLIPKS